MPAVEPTGQAPEPVIAEPNGNRVPDAILWSAATLFMLIMVVSTGILLYFSFPVETLRELGKAHSRALLGMPCCAMMSLTVLSLLRVSAGPIEFEALGFKFRGASGPVVLWIFTYLACISGVVALW